MNKLTITRGSPTHRVVIVVAALALAAAALYLPHHYAPYRVFQFSEVLIFAVAVLSLNLLTGYTGQVSLGHSFFFAIGAYITAIMFRDLSVSLAVPIVVAFVVAFVAGFAFGIPALRLSGVYLAVVTIALAIVTPPVITRFESVTGGSQGINIEKPSAPAWTGLADDQWIYYICLAVASVVFLTARNLVRGRVGRAMTALRDNELAASGLGVNPATTKTLTFAYSAGFAGVAGALYTLVVGLVAPGSFTIILAINLLVGAVVGGLATIAGALFGGAFIVFVPVYASDVNPALGGVIYGAALIAAMFVMPGGVMGLARRVRAALVTVEEPATGAPTGGTLSAPTPAGESGISGRSDDGESLPDSPGPGSPGQTEPDAARRRQTANAPKEDR